MATLFHVRGHADPRGARPAPSPPARSHNHLFDALRGLAAVGVMLFHLTNIEKRQIVPGGYLAVDFFFLLSGFVLWNAYGDRLRNGLSAGSFIALRLRRLYPLFAMGLLLGIARAIGGMHLGDPRAPTVPALMREALASALLLPSAIDAQSVFPLDNPAWSLSLEVFVNIAFCVWIVKASRQRLAQTCVAAAVVLALVAHHYGSLDIGWRVESYAGGVARCAFSFTLGVAMARFGLHLRPRPDAELALSAGLLVAFTALLVVDPGHAWRLPFDILCVLFLFPLILALAAGARMTGLPADAAKAAGTISYPLYATHYPLILPLTVIGARLHIGGMIQGVAIAAICIMVACAAVPVDRAIRNARTAGRARQRPPVPAPVPF